jgi:murein DD-endopeptidase MepM/ murein hydrolase activator NlpD
MYKSILAVLFGLVLSFAVNVAFAETSTPAIYPIPDDSYTQVHRWDALTNKWADYYGIPADLIRRMMWFESRGNPSATSPQGAMGLMQVMPYHFYSYENPYDPDTNIMNGAYILWLQYNKYGTWEGAVKGYFGTVGADYWGTTAESYCNAIFDYSKDKTTVAPTTSDATHVFPIPSVKNSISVQLHWGAATGASDLFAPIGSPVVAVAAGSVYFATYSSIGGNCVYIIGDDGLDYYYAHLRSWPAVAAGQHVNVGQLLGYVGATGNAVGTDPHLHIGIGYGIANGTGANGGAGIGYNAVSLLRRLQKQ